jgi:hypothetical protein
MARVHVTESDIVDAALGQASPELEDRVRKVAEGDLRVAAAKSLWEHVAPSIASERVDAEAVNRRLREGVMGRLRSAGREAEDRARARRQVAGALAVAVPVLAAASVLFVIAVLAAVSGDRNARDTQIASATIWSERASGSGDRDGGSRGRFSVTVTADGALRVTPGVSSGILRIDGPVVMSAEDGRLRLGPRSVQKQ